jgi:hypothetical protein
MYRNKKLKNRRTIKRKIKSNVLKYKSKKNMKGGSNSAPKNKIVSKIQEIDENTYDGNWELPIMSMNAHSNGNVSKDIIENYFKYYSQNEHIMKCFHLMLQREHLFSDKDYVVFYHSFAYSHILFDVQSAIAEIIYGLEPDINRVIPRLSRVPFLNANIDNIKRELASGQNNNHSIKSRSLLMSAVCSLFADIEINLIHTFTVGYSCIDVDYKTLLKNLLSECNANEENVDALFNEILEHNYIKPEMKKGYIVRPEFSCTRHDNCGQILQIFIHKTIVDKITYISEPFGVPYIGDEQDCTKATSQVRILVSPEYFLNNDLVKTYRYAANIDLYKNRNEYISYLKSLLIKYLFNTPKQIDIVRRKLSN